MTTEIPSQESKSVRKRLDFTRFRFDFCVNKFQCKLRVQKLLTDALPKLSFNALGALYIGREEDPRTRKILEDGSS